MEVKKVGKQADADKVLLTEREVARLVKKAPSKGQVITWDKEMRGFGLRVSANGTASFVFVYRADGQQRYYTIGRAGELSAEVARNGIVNENGTVELPGAVQLRQQLAGGKDPMEEKQRRLEELRQVRDEPTMGDLIDAFLNDPETLKLRPNTLRSYKGQAAKIIRPELGSVRLKAITRSNIVKLHAKMKDSAPYQGNRTLALLSVMYSFAMHHDRKWVTENPVAGIRRHNEVKRKRYLKPGEVDRFYKALDSYVAEHTATRHKQNAIDSANALRLLLLTGSRLSEVLQADWSEFDLDRGVWVKPADRVKQGEETEIPLGDDVIKILNSMNPSDSGPLFVGRDGKSARVSLKRPWDYALREAKLQNLRKHDLRHSFASFAISHGVPLPVVGGYLGHKQYSTTMRYSHLLDDAMREAANKVGKVLSFDRKRA